VSEVALLPLLYPRVRQKRLTEAKRARAEASPLFGQESQRLRRRPKRTKVFGRYIRAACFGKEGVDLTRRDRPWPAVVVRGWLTSAAVIALLFGLEFPDPKLSGEPSPLPNDHTMVLAADEGPSDDQRQVQTEENAED
jgi:hypothetical protein